MSAILSKTRFEPQPCPSLSPLAWLLRLLHFHPACRDLPSFVLCSGRPEADLSEPGLLRSDPVGHMTARPAQKLQAVFLDVDGTLLDGNHPDLSSSTFDALRSLQKRGIKVALNTSRRMASVLSVPSLARFPFDGYILAGGGEIYDHKRRLLERQTYIPADLKVIFDQCKAMNIPVFFNNQKPNLTLWTEESKRFARKYHLFPLQIKDWSGEEITMITVIDSDPEKIARILEDAPGIRQVSAGPINQDLYPEGVSKGAGVKKCFRPGVWKTPALRRLVTAWLMKACLNRQPCALPCPGDKVPPSKLPTLSVKTMARIRSLTPSKTVVCLQRFLKAAGNNQVRFFHLETS